ncbi:MAG: CPBP family intramembrane glutamic endopeptidase [Gemmatimonadota bacterium]
MRSRPLLSFFVLVFAITWAVATPLLFAPAWFTRHFGAFDSSSPLFYFGVYTPTIVSIVLTAAFEGMAGLKALFSRLDPRRCNPVWYLVVVGGFLLLNIAGAGVGALVGGTSLATRFGAGAGILLHALVFDPGPLGEELGWRGFALPRMLSKRRPLSASLLLGAIWGAWHLPAFYVSSLSQSQLSIPVFMLGAISLSVVVCWLFIRSNGSVLITILAHVMANHAMDIAGATFNQQAYGLALAALVLVLTGQLDVEPKRAAYEPVLAV